MRIRVWRVRSGVMGGARWGAGGGGVRARSATEDGGVDGAGDSVVVECVGASEASVASDGPSVTSGEGNFKRPGILWCCM